MCWLVNLRSLIFEGDIRMRDLLACVISQLVCAHFGRVVVLCLGDERIGFRSEWTE